MTPVLASYIARLARADRRRIAVLRVIYVLSSRVAHWADGHLQAARKLAADRLFPAGCPVRLRDNGCCRATMIPANRVGTWYVKRYVEDAGDYYLVREPGGHLGIFVHATGMERVA